MGEGGKLTNVRVLHQAQKDEVLCELIFATLCAAPHDMQILRGSGGQWLPYDALSCECGCCSYCQMTEDIVLVTTMRSTAQYLW
jgi:hypothetical protein